MIWNQLRKCLSVISIIIGGIATGLEDPYAKVFFAVALGLSNAAFYLKEDQGN